jgi:transcriptional regulator with XRE-family HTH domain
MTFETTTRQLAEDLGISENLITRIWEGIHFVKTNENRLLWSSQAAEVIQAIRNNEVVTDSQCENVIENNETVTEQDPLSAVASGIAMHTVETLLPSMVRSEVRRILTHPTPTERQRLSALFAQFNIGIDLIQSFHQGYAEGAGLVAGVELLALEGANDGQN